MFIYQLHATIKRGHAARKLNEMADGGRSDADLSDDGGETDGDRIKVAARSSSFTVRFDNAVSASATHTFMLQSRAQC